MNVEVISREIFEEILQYQKNNAGSPKKKKEFPLFTFNNVISRPTVTYEKPPDLGHTDTPTDTLVPCMSSKECRQLWFFKSELTHCFCTEQRDYQYSPGDLCSPRNDILSFTSTKNDAPVGKPCCCYKRLPFRIERIKRTFSVTSKMFYNFVERYNKFIDYEIENLGYAANLNVWKINENQLHSNCLAKDVLIALQLHIYCRQLGFPNFIRSAQSPMLWIHSLERLYDIIIQASSLQNELFLQAKVMLCLSMEYTSIKKFGNAEAYLQRAQTILEQIEACEVHAWYHLAAAYFYNGISHGRKMTKPEMTENVFQHLWAARTYFNMNSAERDIFCLESTLIFWWAFLVKAKMTQSIKGMMPNCDVSGISEQKKNLPVDCTDKDCGLVYYQHFFIEEQERHLIPVEAVNHVHMKMQPIVELMQDTHRLKEGRTEDKISAVVKQGFEDLAEYLEWGNLDELVEFAYLDEETHYINIHVMSHGNEGALLKTLRKLIPNIMNRVNIQNSQFLFAVNKNHGNTLAAEERSRITHGEQKSTFGPGSMVFLIEEKHKTNVLCAGDIHTCGDIKKKVDGIKEGPLPTTVTCIAADDHMNLYALTVQHLFTLEENYKTAEDPGYCVLSQINHQSTPNDTTPGIFLVGDSYHGIYSTPNLVTDDETQAHHQESALNITEVTSNSQEDHEVEKSSGVPVNTESALNRTEETSSSQLDQQDNKSSEVPVDTESTLNRTEETSSFQKDQQTDKSMGIPVDTESALNRTEETSSSQLDQQAHKSMGIPVDTENTLNRTAESSSSRKDQQTDKSMRIPVDTESTVNRTEESSSSQKDQQTDKSMGIPVDKESTLNRTEGTSNSQQDKQADKSLGVPDTKERMVKKTVIDLAAVQIEQQLHHKSFFAPFLMNNNNKPVRLELQTKPSQICHGLEVQQIGSASGFNIGKIISTAAVMKIAFGKWTRDVFLVRGREGEAFATHGDSGTLVTPIIGTDEKTLAMGFVHKYEENGPNVLCLNFTESLLSLNKLCHLDLVLHNPPECEAMKTFEDSNDSGMTESEDNAHSVKVSGTPIHGHQQQASQQESVEQNADGRISKKQVHPSESDSGIEGNNEM